MEKFTKIQNENPGKKEKNEELIYTSDNIKIKELLETKSFQIIEQDQVVCIPYLTEYNQVILNQVENQTFESVDGKLLHISALTAYVKEEYDLKWELMKMLETKVGIVIRDKYPFEFDVPLFESKNGTKRIHFCMLPLSESDYHQVLLSNDIKKNEYKLVKIDAKYLSSINASDITTQLAIDKAKKFLNIS